MSYLQDKKRCLSAYHAVTLLNSLLPGMLEVHVHQIATIENHRRKIFEGLLNRNV